MSDPSAMDIDALHSALISLTLVPEEIRSAREDLAKTKSGARPELRQFLNSIEHDLRLAKATLARELGFPLCKCCWPPELLARDCEGKAHCPARVENITVAEVEAPRGNGNFILSREPVGQIVSRSIGDPRWIRQVAPSLPPQARNNRAVSLHA